jgi:exodeoxyribonuclease-3
VSWNVNGIRACVNKGFVEWFETVSPDILCLQEIKANEEQVPKKILNFSSKYDLTFFPAEKKGYSGVATFVKKSLKSKSTKGIGIKKFDDEGRTILTEVGETLLINSYYPNGQRDHGRVDFKLEFSETMLKYAKKNEKKFKNIILTGDFNTAHFPIDLANPKTNKNTTGFLPHEREWMDRLVAKGYLDTYRFIHGQKEGAYSWWTYRNNCRDRNIGWRIDYFFINEDSKSNIRGAEILQDIQGSDHCPISLDLKKL